MRNQRIMPVVPIFGMSDGDGSRTIEVAVVAQGN